ncbi:neogenin isoform X2 [Ischnura elegans]|uniref:neogenin isoform X2 n=1 Tax=Ischnura elegans TaxID=197161 RepID=UPI001ED8BB37|nr:neogenin isoform X2 [Ischnura elegans]
MHEFRRGTRRKRSSWLPVFGIFTLLASAVNGFDVLRFENEPRDEVVEPGGSAVLDCSARGVSEASISWRGPGGNTLTFIGDAFRSQLPNGSLLLTNIWSLGSGRRGGRGPEDGVVTAVDDDTDEGCGSLSSIRGGPGAQEGFYQCMATIESVGSIVSRKAWVGVARPPCIEIHPQDQLVLPGGTAHFACLPAASSNGPPFVGPSYAAALSPKVTITWLRDGQPLSMDSTRMTVLPSGSLEVDEVSLSDSGQYRCNVSSLGKYRLSRIARLTVERDPEGATPPVFTAKPRSSVVVKGRTVVLDCAASGNPRPVIMWLKDGVTIDMTFLDSRLMMVGSGSLQIERVQEDDEGTYQCRAENKEDSVDASASLQVLVPPVFVKKPKDHWGQEKEDLELECKVSGRPEPRVHWVKNGDPINQNEYLQVVNGNNLRILGLMALDSGIFQCVASNPAGNVHAEARLHIAPIGTLFDSKIKHPQPTTPRYPTAAAAHTIPPVISSLLPSAIDGTHTSGESQPTKDVPSMPRALAAVYVDKRFVTLKWKAPTKNNSTIFTYSVFYRQEGSERERVVNTTRSRLEEVNVPGLVPGREYWFRVVAHNRHGAGAPSSPLKVRTQTEAHVPGPPTNLRVTPTSATSLLVQWEQPTSPPAPKPHQYELYYSEEGSREEHRVLTSEHKYELRNLKKYWVYIIWVAAVSPEGPGAASEEAKARTLSDLPSEAPQNVTVETASSTSIIVRWESPSLEGQNGVITGYKIRYRRKGKRRGETVTTAGDQRLHVLTGLEKSSEYQIRMWALTVNGTGPSSEWLSAETYENDREEIQVPDPPSSLKARPMANSILVAWNPPRNPSIMVRGYTIGWGKGIPDVYTQLLDGKQRTYTIESLEANSEYVISLRAYNEMGDGRPVYETVRTREPAAPEPQSQPLVPPVGLRAIILSASTVVLYWTDSSLPKSQVTDNRHYVVRYTSSHHSPNPRYKFFNASDLNCMLDELKPNTQYEFTVKLVKGRRESPWSMVVLNTTQEAAPSSHPRDLTVVPVEGQPSVVNLNWQPPKQPNGQITGYVVFYTTDSSQKDRDWVVEGVVGDRMTTVVRGLTPATTYYFKIQARNLKGYGPYSSIVSFTTAAGNGVPLQESGTTAKDGRGGGMSSTMMLYLAIGATSLLVIFLVVLITVICFRHRNSHGPDRSKKGYMKGTIKGKIGAGIGAGSSGSGSGPGGKGSVKPPDLWIHHDQMELKALEKTQAQTAATPASASSSTAASPSEHQTAPPVSGPRHSSTGQDFDSEDKFRPGGGGSLDKRGYVSSYVGAVATATPIGAPNGATQHGHHAPQQHHHHHHHGPGMVPSSSDVGGPTVRPMYPRTQYSIARAHVTLDPAATHSPEATGGYDSVLGPVPNQASYPGSSSVPGMAPAMQIMPGTSHYGPGMTGMMSAVDGGSGTMGKRGLQGHPLKSFSVPAPPPQSAPSTPQPKHAGLRGQVQAPPPPPAPPPTSGVLPSQGSSSASSSPYKKAPHSPLVMASSSANTASTATSTPKGSRGQAVASGSAASTAWDQVDETTRLQPSYSTEELNQEMANLEGLMKDLNAITASEFEC